MAELYAAEDDVMDQSANTKAKLTDLSKNDLIQLIGYLEQEVHNRDTVINQVKSEQTKQVLYQAKYGRFGASDPFSALQRDSDRVDRDNFDPNQVKASFDNQLQQLENLIETQRRAQAKMREQKQAADERYRKVYEELAEVRQKYAADTAQGDDLTVALTKEREKLQQDLAYEKNQTKKLEKEINRLQELLEEQRKLSQKHKKVSIDLIKERRGMVAKITVTEKRNEAIAHLLNKQQEDNKKSENSKLLQLEAKMEKQLMDFDIEREQMRAKLRKEESKVRDLVAQLTDIKEAMLALQRESPPTPVTLAPPTFRLSSNITEKSADIHNSITTANNNINPAINNVLKQTPTKTTIPKVPHNSPIDYSIQSQGRTTTTSINVRRSLNVQMAVSVPDPPMSARGTENSEQTAKLVSGPMLSPPPGKSRMFPQPETQPQGEPVNRSVTPTSPRLIHSGAKLSTADLHPAGSTEPAARPSTNSTRVTTFSNLSTTTSVLKNAHKTNIVKTNAPAKTTVTAKPVPSHIAPLQDNKSTLSNSLINQNNLSKNKPPPPVRNVSLNRKSIGDRIVTSRANQSTF